MIGIAIGNMMSNDLFVYDKDIELVTHEGVWVTIKLYRLKNDPPFYPESGKLSYWEKYDFWNRVRRKVFFMAT